jgi:hypothetical protein
MATPTLGDPLSSALAMSTPVKTCPPHISSGRTCQSVGGAGHERDNTDAPPPVVPWSERESVLKGDIPALPATAYFGYAAAVNGDATLSCPSPPHLATGDFGRPWRFLPCSSTLGFYFDDTGLSIPLSSSLPPAHLQPRSYLLSPQDLPRCRRRFRRPGQSRADRSTKSLERTRNASWQVTTDYISPSRQTTTGYVETSGSSGLVFSL